jgi:hypothetical protein
MNAPEGLARQQRALAALIVDQAEIADDAPRATALLRPLAGAPPRLGIYRGAFRGRLVEALRSNYPVLHRVLGDDDFAALALAYLAEHPSRAPSIRWFGHRLPSWLAHRLEADADALPHPALADLARMEWAVGCSFDAADAAPLERDALARTPPPRWPALRFAAHPSVQVIELAWSVEPLWRALTDDEQAQTAPPEAHAHRLLVWRQGLETRWRALPPDEAGALGACLAGECFADLCERIAAADPAADAAARAAGWLGAWVQAGLLLRSGHEG